jgi:hypothetical protein
MASHLSTTALSPPALLQWIALSKARVDVSTNAIWLLRALARTNCSKSPGTPSAEQHRSKPKMDVCVLLSNRGRRTLTGSVTAAEQQHESM